MSLEQAIRENTKAVEHLVMQMERIYEQGISERTVKTVIEEQGADQVSQHKTQEKTQSPSVQADAPPTLDDVIEVCQKVVNKYTERSEHEGVPMTLGQKKWLAILAEFGVKKNPDLKPEQYAEVIEMGMAELA